MKRDPLHVAEKTNWVLHLILLGMLIISIRIWHLAIIQHDRREEEAKRPQHRVMIEPTKRATIRDRYNLPLAINKIEYQATILYENLTAIPRIAWELDETGKKVKRFKRRTYIRELSEYLAKELNLGADRIEDLIHSKAAIYGNRPYIIKENIDEQTFFRLKGHEREWPGLLARPYPKREYPQGKVAGEILGYLGAISKEEYEAILSERNALKELLAEEYSEAGHQRLLDLDEMAYSMHDTVGKAGIEKQYERQLRGFQGKTHYLADAKGNMLERLPGSREPVAGQRLLLTLSSELQEYAEQLLMENERVRQTRISGMSVEEQTRLKLKDPWIKGGAIVAMDPHTGEVLALASYPRMDPNDFIEKNSNNVQQWYETDTYVGQIWERQQPLYREKTGDIELDWLTWNKFLRMILPENHEILYQLQQHPTLNDAVTVQNRFAQLCQEHPLISPYQLVQNLPSTHPLWNHLNTIPYDREKLLLIDLYRILVDHERFSDTVLDVFGNQTLSEYHHIGGQLWKHQRELKHIVRQHFRETTFATWRQEE
ncbi:MAG: hypothetical protein KDK65_04775, partial [Chlamydiia bacterium]|nr:hypothetical protein [Chlamydiia bacterium]